MKDMHKTRSHRDLKPANIMVSGWDSDDALQPHIIDFANSYRHEGDLLQCVAQHSMMIIVGSHSTSSMTAKLYLYCT